jgi:hypothetical protein
MARKQEHNEYFRSTTAKRCPCGNKGLTVWSWGEYHIGKWNTVKWFCERCFEERVKGLLCGHTETCGCTVNIIGYHGEELPQWLTME